MLTSHPKFPSAPDVVSYLEAIELPPTVEVNTGSRLSGFLQVTNSGSYHFAIASDDQSALYLSTDESPTNKRLLAAEPEWNNSRNWSSNERRVNSSGNTFFPSLKTVPINRTAFTVGAVTLQAGARYYFEVLHKQGGGGGHVAVTMYPSTSSLPADNSPAISGSKVSNFINPDNTITITKQPVSQFASHFASVQLRAELAAVGGIPSLQWFKNGVPIANARQTNLTVSASTLTTGDAFRLEARLPGATVSSDIARVWIVNGEPELQIERLPDARAVIRWPTSPGSELLE
ncbi:MAG TPA: hypothetical protein DCY13_11955, partial [Verrucomicrobiales bacterium]|nr:hypothetical protein [Verrucomicrobiales bacterium]